MIWKRCLQHSKALPEENLTGTQIQRSICILVRQHNSRRDRFRWSLRLLDVQDATFPWNSLRFTGSFTADPETEIGKFRGAQAGLRAFLRRRDRKLTPLRHMPVRRATLPGSGVAAGPFG